MPRKISKKVSKRRRSKSITRKRVSKKRRSSKKRVSKVKSFYKKYQHGGDFFNKTLTGQKKGGQADETDHASQINQVIKALTEKLQNISCGPAVSPAVVSPAPAPVVSPVSPAPVVSQVEQEDREELDQQLGGYKSIGFGGHAQALDRSLGLL